MTPDPAQVNLAPRLTRSNQISMLAAPATKKVSPALAIFHAYSMGRPSSQPSVRNLVWIVKVTNDRLIRPLGNGLKVLEIGRLQRAGLRRCGASRSDDVGVAETAAAAAAAPTKSRLELLGGRFKQTNLVLLSNWLPAPSSPERRRRE